MDIPRLRFENWGDPDFPLVAIPAGVGGGSELHRHDFHELVYVRRGGGVHVIEDRPYPMLRGDFYLMRPDDAHGYRDPEGAAIVNLLFRPSLFPPAQARELRGLPGMEGLFLRGGDRAPPRKLALAPADAAAVEKACDRLIREGEERAPGWRTASRAVFADLLVRVARAWATYGNAGEPIPVPSPIARVLTHLHERWHEDLRIPDLAALTDWTPNWFGERFRDATGLTVQAYLAKLRVDHARMMLEDGDDDVTRIALAVGFADPSYFGRVFRRLTGTSPRDYRKLVRDGSPHRR